jgi:hypothetical protein
MKKGIARWLPVSLIDSAGAPVLSKAYGDVVAEFRKESGTGLTVKTLDVNKWKEHGQGRYAVLFSSGDLDTKGGFDYVITGAGFLKYDGWFDLEDSDIGEVKTDTETIIERTENLPDDPASNTEVDTRLATSGYTAPANSDITTIKSKTNNLPADPASNTQVNSRLASASYVAPDNTSILDIKERTKNLPDDPASEASATANKADVLAKIEEYGKNDFNGEPS